MATAGEKLVNDRARRHRPFFEGKSVEQAARILVTKNPEAFVGMSKTCACKQVSAALHAKVSRGELVLGIRRRGRAPKAGLRRPTHAEQDRFEKKGLNGPRRKKRLQNRPGHTVAKQRREAARLKQGLYAA